MKPIEIADRPKFFSHAPGHFTLVPGTQIRVKAFPTALFFTDEEGFDSELIFSNLQGPVDPFTVEQDLERRQLRIYGEAKQGYFRLSLAAEENTLVLRFEKTPLSGILVEKKTFVSGDFLEIANEIAVSKEPFEERLFLGSSKKKDLALIRLRKDLREVFPLWYFLGKITPSKEEKPFSILKEAIASKDKKKAQDLFLHAYLAHFSSGLVPRKEDEERQGLLSLTEIASSLLQAGSSCIRSLFFQEKEDAFHILPCLIPLFVCGKMIWIKTESGCLIDMEWTKHRLRRMCIRVEKDQILKLYFPSDVESFRVKMSSKDGGRILAGKGSQIPVKAGALLWFDLFQK
jgi:hypothetical protein